MHDHHYYSLKAQNTFGIDAKAEHYIAVETEAELQDVLARHVGSPIMILGGGSNVILRGDIAGLVIHPAMRGIECLEETQDTVLVEAAAGENWHEFVQYCLMQGWFGLENLSLIPGSVGAAPIQNIGAYGVEITDYFDSLTAVSRDTQELTVFTHTDCQFSYRDSVFKQSARDKYIITRVRFRLPKQPTLKLGYGDIQQELARQQVTMPTPRDVADAIMAIRRRKLPDPAVLGNSGSFFKNPVISADEFLVLKMKFPDMVAYPQGDEVKLAAGWLIDRAGWRGRRLGAVGPYEHQALVLVNHGGATGADVLAVAQAIQADVKHLFNVNLEMEPACYGG